MQYQLTTAMTMAITMATKGASTRQWRRTRKHTQSAGRFSLSVLGGGGRLGQSVAAAWQDLHAPNIQTPSMPKRLTRQNQRR
jgi:predicted transposase YbfD/YdcC